jgi:Xaa-Pro aminopeptidase
MNHTFYQRNRQEIIRQMEEDSILVLFAGKAPRKTADEYYRFTPNRNFLYMTGIDEDSIILMIEKTGSKTQETLFIQKADPVLEKWVGKRIDGEEAKKLSGIESIRYLEEFENTFTKACFNHPRRILYLDLERMEWDEPYSKGQAFAMEVRKRFPHLQIRNIYHPICQLRTIKSQEEIEKIRKAIQITAAGVESLMENARPGMMEYELEAHFDYTIKTLGAKDFAFTTIAASGKNGTILHYSENNQLIEPGSLILFDLGAQYDYYSADISRTFPVSGKFSKRQKKIYEIVLKAQSAVIDAIKPGVPYRRLNEITIETYSEECRRIGLIREDSEISCYYYHNVSHFLGLDTHDVGIRDTELKPGMVITVEPGLYIEEEGIGIRIEDDVLVTENGCEVLSKDIIKTVEEIEAFMNT